MKLILASLATILIAIMYYRVITRCPLLLTAKLYLTTELLLLGLGVLILKSTKK